MPAHRTPRSSYPLRPTTLIAYGATMDEDVEFTWDPAKSDACYQDRGFDFEYGIRIFQGNYLERVDERLDYGEVRRQVIGYIDYELYLLVYTQRDRAKHIISCRRTKQKELNKWLRSG